MYKGLLKLIQSSSNETIDTKGQPITKEALEYYYHYLKKHSKRGSK